MLKLGLKPRLVQYTSVVAFPAILALGGLGCTRAANQEPVPPPSASNTSAAVAVSPPDGGAGVKEAPNAASATSSKAYDDSTRTIDAKLGERFTVNLPANVTTPYKWVVASPEEVVALVERHYDDSSPAKCDGCVGRGGTDRLTFEAKHEGSATLLLKYAPLRSKSEPAQREVSISVTVTK